MSSRTRTPRSSPARAGALLTTTAALAAILGCWSGALARPSSRTDDPRAAAALDMATVGSLRRELRQPAPRPIATEVADLLSASNDPRRTHERKKHAKNASGTRNEGGLYKTYGSDAEGEKGYLKKSFSKGDHGYKSLDTFHKKLGDRYGFEEHKAFGKADGKEEGKHQGKSASSKRKHSDDHEGAGTDVETHYADDEGDEYSEGGDGDHYDSGGEGDHYEGGGGGGGGGDSSSSSGYGEVYVGEGEGESYSSAGDGDGSGESYYAAAGGDSSGEDGGSYYR